jgi:hypothetical protein
MNVHFTNFISLNERKQSILIGGDLLRDGSNLIVMVLAKGIMTFQNVEAFFAIQMGGGLKTMPKKLDRAILFKQKYGVYT